MTIQELIFLLKEDGWTDTAVTVGVCHFLVEKGHPITRTTRLIIKKYLRLYSQFIKEVA